MFIDDYSRMSFLYFLKRKLDVHSRVQQFLEFAERRTVEKVKHLQQNNGGKYTYDELDTYLKQQRTVSMDTEQFTALQNGLTKRCSSA